MQRRDRNSNEEYADDEQAAPIIVLYVQLNLLLLSREKRGWRTHPAVSGKGWKKEEGIRDEK